MYRVLLYVSDLCDSFVASIFVNYDDVIILAGRQEVDLVVRTLSVKWMCNIKCTEPINVCCVYRWTWPYFN